MTFFTSLNSALTFNIGAVLCLIAVSGSFSPCPVSVQTTLELSGILPSWIFFNTPASEVA